MSSEALERAIRAVLDDVSGAAVASDTRVHVARAALDALLAEVARLEQERDDLEGELADFGESRPGRLARAEAALAVAREREQRAVEALTEIAAVCTPKRHMQYIDRVIVIRRIARVALVDAPAAATLAEPDQGAGPGGSARSVSPAVRGAGLPSGSASAAADEPKPLTPDEWTREHATDWRIPSARDAYHRYLEAFNAAAADEPGETPA